MIMKKYFIIPVAGVLLASCGSTDYKPAAEAMCKCMEEKAKEEQNELLGKDFDYTACAIDVMLETRTDINNKSFGDALALECEDLKGLHDEYLSDL